MDDCVNVISPFVVHIQDPNAWPLLEMLGSLDSLVKQCSIPLNFRVIDRHNESTQWEDEAPTLELTPGEFAEWLAGSPTELPKPLSADNFALYCAYQYMHETFEQCPNLLKLIDWSPIGLTDRDATHTTFWLGSAGAYTPGHYDTYGCNFVAQVFGQKRWVLFPPEQGEYLYPTRLPYEESSVFCRCSLAKVEKFPKLQKTTPYFVDLNPGDILYVPPKWWHFVTCLNTSLAINTWIDIPHLDNFSRLKEALVRWIVASQLEGEENNVRINYTEKDLPSTSVCETYIQTSVKLVKSESNQQPDSVSKYASQVVETANLHKWSVVMLEAMKFDEFVDKTFKKTDDSSSEEEEEDDDDKRTEERVRILDALLDSDVIELAAKKLLLHCDDY